MKIDLFRTPYGIASRFRIAFYRVMGMKIGLACRLENIRIRRPGQIVIGSCNSLTEGCWLWPIDSEFDGCRIQMGNHNYFNRDVMIDACGSVKIGDYNMFGPGVYITDSNHTMASELWVTDCPMDVGAVVIGNGCWIGAGAKILKGVSLGDRCIVGAGAVVTKSYPAGSTVLGVPAKLVGSAVGTTGRD